MQVNHNCQILFKFGTGINSARYILPQSNPYVQGVPAQHVIMLLCLLPAWMRRQGLLTQGQGCLKPVSADEQLAVLRRSAPMCVATVPSCASERW